MAVVGSYAFQGLAAVLAVQHVENTSPAVPPVSPEHAVCTLLRPASVLVSLNSSKCLTWPVLFLGTVTAKSCGGSLRNALTAWVSATVTCSNDSGSGQRAVLQAELVEIIFLLFSCQEARVYASLPPDELCELPAMLQMSVTEVLGESSLYSGEQTSDTGLKSQC